MSLLKNASNPNGVLGAKASGEPPLCMSSSVYFAVKQVSTCRGCTCVLVVWIVVFYVGYVDVDGLYLQAVLAARQDAGASSAEFYLAQPATVDQVSSHTRKRCTQGALENSFVPSEGEPHFD